MKNFDRCLIYIERLFIIFVLFYYINDVILIIHSLVNKIYLLNLINYNDFICHMADATVNSASTASSVSPSTNVSIIHADGTWSETIRTLFIYGAGTLRLTLGPKTGGTPGFRAVTVASTIAADLLTKVLHNTINNPFYVRDHHQTWKVVWANRSEGQATVEVDPDTSTKLAEAVNTATSPKLSDSSNFWSDLPGLEDLANSLTNHIIDNFRFILEPVQVNYSTSVLADQIYDISILLFILSILILGLFIVFTINVIILINTDHILNFFKNKYIRMYVIFNKKIITLEVIFLGLSILYFMYNLSMGIHFIATHPLNP